MSFCLLKDSWMRHNAVVETPKFGLEIPLARPLGRGVLELHPRLVFASNNGSVHDAINFIELNYRAEFCVNRSPLDFCIDRLTTEIVLVLPGINAWIGSTVSKVVKG